MNMESLRFLVLVTVILQASAFFHRRKPNIIVIMADDMGYNDVGMHGSSQIPTPNIDALAYNGQNLNKHYTMHICTPSRAAFLTGNYPIRNGMQGTPLRPGEERDISSQVKFTASWLNKRNYVSKLVGKWHLGHYNKEMVPTGRGFTDHIGYYNGYCGYFDYMISDAGINGYDLHRNNIPDWKQRGIYATDFFTREAEKIIREHNKLKPLFLVVAHLAAHTGANGTLEVKNVSEANSRFAYINEPHRRLYADIVRELDISTGRIMMALAENNMLANSIVLWFSDNGGQTIDPFYGYSNYASNWPLRGMKFTLNEGGVRNIAAIWSPLLKNKQIVNSNPIHLVDWLPTFYAAAGGNINDLGSMDGINLWPMFTGQESSPSKRTPMLLNIDEVLGFEGILSPDGRYKLLNGTFPHGDYDDYYGDSGRGPKDPSYDVNAVLNSETNKAILSLRNEKPLTADVILRIRNEIQIKEGPGERVKTSNCTNLCLYDLKTDPSEKHDVKDENPEIVAFLHGYLKKYRSEIVPQKNKQPDPASNPNKCNDVWFTWKEPFNFECLPIFKDPLSQKPQVAINLKSTA